MKQKLFIALAAFFAFLSAEAQVTFRPGIRAGVNFSYFTEGDNYYSDDVEAEFTSKTDFYVGFYGALKLSKYYTLQPEIDYSRQGSNIEFTGPDTDLYSDSKVDLSYLSIGIMNKFSFTEKFNVHIGPSMDFIVEKPENVSLQSDVDLAFTAGFEFNFTKNFSIEARVKKGIIPVIDSGDFEDDYHTNVNFSVGGTYTFDLK